MTEPLLGHGPVEATLARMARAGRMPHAILLGGPRGIGKATLARRLAQWLLAGYARQSSFGLDEDLAVDPEDPVVRRVVAGSHADLITVERAWDPKRKRLRGEIIADDARKVFDFFHLTPAEGGWRIAIIDGVEAMNRQAANAILKILEEPPPRCLLILVTHEPGRLLPTIRSRCRVFRMQTLPIETVSQMLERISPAVPAADRALLARLSGGSIGRALDYHEEEVLQLYRGITRVLGTLPRLDVTALHALAEDVGRRDTGILETMSELMLDIMSRVLGTASGEGRAGPPTEELAFLEAVRRSGSLDRWVALWEKLHHLLSRAASVNLDRKQVVLDAFLAVEAVAAS